MKDVGDYIPREEAEKRLSQIAEIANSAYIDQTPCQIMMLAQNVVHLTPAADVRPVVLCGVCELHGHCYTEDVFAFARLAEGNRFCAVGKVKTNGEKMEES